MKQRLPGGLPSFFLFLVFLFLCVVVLFMALSAYQCGTTLTT